jgi:D-methionine transport system substrate-binding protein
MQILYYYTANLSIYSIIKCKNKVLVPTTKVLEDLAVTSASFLIQAKVSLNPIVLDEIGIANKNYAVGLATVQSKVNDPNIQKLNQLVVDPKLKDYINNYFKGTITPVF